MTKTQYTLILLLTSALLPLAAISPYFFYGQGFRVLAWVWDTGYWPFWLNFGISIAGAVLSFSCLYNFNSFGRIIFTLSAMLVTGISALFAMSEHRHSLLVVVFVLAALLVWTSEWLRQILELPYYNSRRNWWEAYSKAVPGISVVAFEKEGGEKSEAARVVNFGETGCFLFLMNKKWEFTPKFLEFSFQNGRKLSTKVAPIIFTADRSGVGLRFDRLPHRDDWHQDLQDFLNGLRRAGYVSG